MAWGTTIDADGHTTKWYTVKRKRGSESDSAYAKRWKRMEDRVRMEKAFAKIAVEQEVMEFARILQGTEPFDITGGIHGG